MANEREGSPEPEGPRPIRKLDTSLVNRIAAGEIIHRPASALKELVENCLDAGSTSIRVNVKEGGLKVLQIQDNGCGIRKQDLPILAERFTTSKITNFADLSSLKTYGFRGEALASISHVAHLSVITKTNADSCAWKACYSDGALTPSKPGLTPDPKACAGNDGTTITAENLFYNVPTRLSALKNSAEEYARILDVVTRYATHNPKVSFTCKKAGSSGPDLSTPSNSTTRQAIRLLYGQAIAKELLEVSFDSSKIQSATTPDEEINENDMEVDDDNPITSKRGVQWKGEACFTGANYHAKKMVFLLFINHRLVESTRIKRALETVYSAILPKGTSPFIYLSLEIDPRAVDVNVHPTKREVHFLNEEELIERVSDVVQQTLAAKSRSRTFECQTQTLLTARMDTGSGTENVTQNKSHQSAEPSESGTDEAEGSSPLKKDDRPPPVKKAYSKDKVRTNLKDRTLDSMFPVVHPSQLQEDQQPLRKDVTPSASSPAKKAPDIEESVCSLTSVNNLRRAVVKNKHTALTELTEGHIFVGIADLRRSLSLVQHTTRLYLVNHSALAEELFYQLGLRQFGNFHRLKLDPPAPLRTLIRLAVKTEESLKKTGLAITEEEVVNRIANKLMDRAEMLNEYFSMKLNDQEELESLPLLLKGYTPNLDKLPLFLMRLGPQVDWMSEIECFRTFLRELAYFYCPEYLFDQQPEDVDDQSNVKAESWQIQHVVFPALRKYLVAPKSLLDRDVVQIANLPDLYKVFERC